MQYLEIILNLPVNQGFTYSYIPPEKEKPELIPAIGKRAEIMFGNKKTQGFIINISDKLPENCPVAPEKIRPIKRVIDKEPLFGKELIEMAHWLSRYYLCTLGEAVFSMIPSGRRETSAGGFGFEEEVGEKKKNELSPEQSKAVEEILSASGLLRSARNDGGGLFHYLYGPTGSGKTEVFLSLAEKILEMGKGVIYLVPEIGLTGQVVKAVADRFGNTAAVLHSGLTPSQRLSEWHRIMHREARVIVGARSAVFAPVPDLGLIIIDEEHDGSYKSGNNPRYHARQVAMHRCSTLKIPLLMGSATPSVEAWYGMQGGSIVRHRLTKRLAGGEMPHISCIDLSYYPNDGCISKPLEDEINKTLAQKHQTILFLNRRGFTHFFRCNQCGYELKCKNCSVPLTYHKIENRLRCHYCGWSIYPPESCPQCGSLDIGSSGFGTEYIEAETRAKFPNARILRLDTDVLKNKDELLTSLEDFRQGKYDILLGTQMVAKGLNFPNLQLVGVILADAGLHMPDFRAGERTFSLITQVAGRAGRYFPDGKVIVQTYSPGKGPVLYACQSRIEDFYGSELAEREMLDFPPFSRLLRLVFRSFNKSLAAQTAADAVKILEEGAPRGMEIIGPAECPIEKINSSWRYQILLKGGSIIPLQNAARKLLFDYTHNQNVYIEYDVDPVSLL
ncbi:replication restart DNA helicase PriA [Treponema bryantii]|uniref:Replication restart protein PriA n=1 Tax=Treponema bryantii TaxID=163 RepID=A0A1H9I7W7_9SPIR|nr:primosomal protein N' [Treponema bryantii]SEQ70667.1 replication restart DNA helicase PriA [Treponema bryantii]